MIKHKVLIVDDEPINIKIVAEILSQKYDLLVATNANIAFKIIENTKPDLILLDIVMPMVDGYEVAKTLKSNDNTKDIPFIFLTSKDNEEDIVKGFNLGAVDYIRKPFNNEELNVRVKNHLKIDTLSKELSNELKKSKKNLEIIDKYVSFIKTDIEANITDISSSFCARLGTTKDFLLNKHISVLKSNHTSEKLYQTLWETISKKEQFQCEIEDINFFGSTNWYSVTISPDYDEYNNFIGYIAFYENIDDKVEIKSMAEKDQLTGIYNRIKLNSSIIIEIENANRYRHYFSVIIVDIDYFKKVNDTYGHQVGDMVLKEVTNILSSNIRKGDILGRWGGEEFFIICPRTDINGAKVLAEHLKEKVNEANLPKVGKKSISLGVSQYEDGKSPEKLFEEADLALYKAKENGRNRVELFFD